MKIRLNLNLVMRKHVPGLYDQVILYPFRSTAETSYNNVIPDMDTGVIVLSRQRTSNACVAQADLYISVSRRHKSVFLMTRSI